MTDRPTLEVATPPGGWGMPWPNVAEIETALPHESWTLVGGLMTQLHAVHAGIDTVRPTNDVDIVLHVETTRGVAATAATALEGLGYVLTPPIDPREGTAHRFVRDDARVDVITTAPDVVDVLAADHAAPSVTEKLRGHTMIAVEGGTQALRRTFNARLAIIPGRATTISTPDVFGAVVLKAAAYRTDSRDPERHLHDAASLLSCLEDPYADRERFTGSDRQRLETLRVNLPDGARAWRALPAEHRRNGQAALRILTA
ncbi:hypothetical protein [Promicromonospora sukumoe]